MEELKVRVSYEHERGAVVLAVPGDWSLEYLSVNADGNTYLTLHPKPTL